MNKEKFTKIINPNKFFTQNSPNLNKKRNRNSTDTSTEIPKKSCNIPSPPQSHNMSEIQDLKEFVKEFRQEMRSSLDELKNTFQGQIDSLNARVTAIENSPSIPSNDLKMIQSELASVQCRSEYNTNRIEQQKLDCELVARGLPSVYASKIDELMSILNEKLNTKLSNDTLEIRSIASQLKNPTSTYFMTFSTKSHKKDFMKAFNTFRNKEIVTLEDLFIEFKPTNQAGKQITFRNSLTKFSKGLLDAALCARRTGHLYKAYEQDGKIFMVKNDGENRVEAVSLDHIQQFSA